MRVARFPCSEERALYEGASAVDWSRFLACDGRLVVDAHASESALAHTRFVEQRVKDAIVDQLRAADGTRPGVDREDADLGVYAHLFRDRCTLLVDTSGRALHRRGWRRDQGTAPLAETLAAALVQLSDWDLRAPLLDPFAGSGTIPIEAALLAGRLAPGLFRERFGFERWPGHDAAGWERERERARAERIPIRAVLRGSDKDPERIAGARANAEAAGVADALSFEVADALELDPRPGWNAWIASNLPYGRRIGAEREVGPLHRRFGALLRERCAGFEVALLCAAGPSVAALRLAGARETRILNGGIECRLVRARIGDERERGARSG
jgi:putative N6-adenine-specific DNA methylase